MRAFVFFLSLFLASTADADRFEPAGRIEDASAEGTCSAALIAPDIIVTAAHCVSEDASQTYLFRLGSGEGSRPIHITRIVIHPLYESFRDQAFRRLRFDIAVGRLAEPVESGQVAPFVLGDEARLSEGLFIVSWPRGSGPRPRARRCFVIEGQVPAVVTLGCRVRGGESGAPLLRLTANGVELVAIVNSRAEQGGQAVALASDVKLRIEPLLDRLNETP